MTSVAADAGNDVIDAEDEEDDDEDDDEEENDDVLISPLLAAAQVARLPLLLFKKVSLRSCALFCASREPVASRTALTFSVAPVLEEEIVAAEEEAFFFEGKN